MTDTKTSPWLALVLAAALAGCAQPPAGPNNPPAAAGQKQAPNVQRQAIAQGLYELAYSPRQNAVFVASSGGRGAGSAPARLLRLDPRTLAVQSELPLERKGFGIALDDAGNRLYIGNSTDGSVTVVDIAANRVLGVVQLAPKVKARRPDGTEVERSAYEVREMVVDAARHRLYVPGLAGENSVLYVIDTRSLEVEKTLPGFGFMAAGAGLDAKRGKLHVSNLQGQLFTVDTGTLAVHKVETAGGDQLLNLAAEQGAGRVFATDQGAQFVDNMRRRVGKLEDYHLRGAGNQVVVLDPADGKLLAALPSGAGPVGLLLDEGRQRLYVTNREEGTVTVFDSRRYALLQTIELPAHPNSLALDAQRNVLYVTVKNGKDDPKDANESVVRIPL